ncbi:MAG: hypothetical protein GY906_12215 [bacterium]|nr:hypothetical protein [bacterium]
MASPPRDGENFLNCPLWAEHRTFLTKDEVDVVVTATVKKTLIAMGIDACDPIEMQRDFQMLRDWRKASTSVRAKILMTAIGLLTAGALGALLIGVKSVIFSKP